MRRRLAALVGLGLALASSVVLAGGIALSPEIGLGAPTSGPAFDAQVNPGGAFDGTNYLVAWHSLSNPQTPSLIFGTRVAPNGTVLDPVGFPISPVDASLFRAEGGPVVASDGTSSLVVYRASSTTYGASIVGRFVSNTGVPQGADIVIASGSCFVGCKVPPRMVFDGTNYLVAWVNDTVNVARVTPAGVVLDPGGIVLPSGSLGDYAGLLGVTCDPVNCLVSYVGGSSGGGRGVRISRAGAIVDATPIDYGVASYENSGIPHVVFDGTNHVVLAGDHLVRVTPSGSTSWVFVSGWVTPRGLAFDGANIHALHGYDRSTLGLHVLVDPTTGTFSGGDATDAKVYYGSSGYGRYQQALFCGTVGCLAAWTDDDGKIPLGGATDIYVARFGTNGGLQGPARGTNVSLAAETAINASTAASSTQGLAVFSYDEEDRWDTTLRGPIRASRISTAGSLLDPSGILVGPSGTSASVGAGSDRTDFVVSWAAEGVVWARRVSAAGAVLDPAPLQVGAGDGSIRVVWDGANYGIFWRATHGSGPGTGGFRRMSPAGTFVDSAPIQLPRDAQVACNGTHYLLAWSELPPSNGPNEIWAIRMDKAGNFIEPQPITVSAGVGSRTAPRVATDGTDFFVAWGDNRNSNTAIYGARVTAAGAVVDATGFPIAEGTFGTPASHTIGVMTYSAKRSGYVVVYDKVSNGTKTHLLATVQGTTVTDRTEVDVSPTSLAAIGSGPMLGTYKRVDLANPFAAIRARARLYDFTGDGGSSSSSSTSSSGGTDGGSTTSSSGSSSGGSSSSGSSSGGGSSSTSASSSGGGGSSSGGSSPNGDPGGGGTEDGGGSCSAGGRGSPASVVPAFFLGALLMRRRRRNARGTRAREEGVCAVGFDGSAPSRSLSLHEDGEGLCRAGVRGRSCAGMRGSFRRRRGGRGCPERRRPGRRE